MSLENQETNDPLEWSEDDEMDAYKARWERDCNLERMCGWGGPAFFLSSTAPKYTSKNPVEPNLKENNDGSKS